MPFLIKLGHDMLKSTHENSIIKTLFGMNEFIQNLEYDIKFYIKDTIELLLSFLKGQFSREVLYWALTTMSNTINTAEKKIVPYKE